MKKIVMLLILFAYCVAGQEHNVKIVVEAKNIKKGEKLFITGNHVKLGYWNPGRVELKNTKEKFYEAEFSFSNGIILEFKFTKGSWETEELNPDGSTPENKYIKVQKDTTLKFVINNWKGENNPGIKPVRQITGTVKYHNNMEFEDLLPRDVIVWLPPNYNVDKDARYPVLYMHDGQNIIDPATSAFGVDWEADETADSLIRKNLIEPIIIVGVYNTEDRNSDYSPGEKGSMYMEFLAKKLKPFIDNTYRTKPERENTAVAGSSMGGLISFMVIWNYPQIFGKAACFSSAFKFNDFDYAKMIADDPNPEEDLLIYLDNGGIGLEQRLQKGNDLILDQLRKRGYIENIDFVWVQDLDARHSEPDWAERLPFVMKLFFGK